MGCCELLQHATWEINGSSYHMLYSLFDLRGAYSELIRFWEEYGRDVNQKT